MDDKELKKSARTKAIAYIILRLIVVGIMVRGIFTQRWSEVFFCALTLVEFMIPSIVEKKLKIELPSALEIVVLLFIFASEILGEIGEFYHKVPAWDLILHTTNGFLMAAIGIALIDVLNKSPKINLSLSPFFAAFVAFCFSMTIGVLWEFGEYTADHVLGTDMQKDTVLSSIITEELGASDIKKAVRVDNITKTVIYGEVDGEAVEVVVENGYLDLGLMDTIEDMFVNLIGAVVFCFFGGIFIKTRGGGQVAGAFIPQLLTDEELEKKEKTLKNYRWRLFRRRKPSKGNDSAGNSAVGSDVNDGKAP